MTSPQNSSRKVRAIRECYKAHADHKLGDCAQCDERRAEAANRAHRGETTWLREALSELKKFGDHLNGGDAEKFASALSEVERLIKKSRKCVDGAVITPPKTLTWI